MEIKGKRVLYEGKTRPGGVDVTAEVEKWLAART
jgi:hypothetical protein